jgi:hypothetical protein
MEDKTFNKKTMLEALRLLDGMCAAYSGDRDMSADQCIAIYEAARGFVGVFAPWPLRDENEEN